MEDFVPKDKTKVAIVYFTEARVKMIYECNNHPVLVAELEALGKVDWAETIGEIAAYCNVMMDGIYTNDDLEILYPQLTKRMTDTRLGHGSGIMLSSDINQAKDKSNLS